MMTEMLRGLHYSHHIAGEMHKRLAREIEALPWWAVGRRHHLQTKATAIFEVTQAIFAEAEAEFSRSKSIPIAQNKESL